MEYQHNLKKFQAARLRAARERPYFSTALWALILIESPGLGTFAVDRYWRCYIDPEKLKQWSIQECAGAIIHEIGHLLRNHADRGDSINAEQYRWNLAGDAEINDDLIAEKITLPENPITPDLFGAKNGLLAEEYYPIISETPNKSTHDCGSCSGGQPRNYEKPTPLTPFEGISQKEAALIRKEVARRILEEGKNRGTLTVGWKRWATQILDPKHDWRKELASLIRNTLSHVSGSFDYHRSRPSRRYSGNVIMPALRHPVPNITICVDTSGSMSDNELSQALGEIKGVLLAAGHQSLTVISGDTHQATCQKIFHVSNIELIGGGGTNMGQLINTAAQQYPRPDLILVITDGFTPWCEKPRYSKVVAALTQENNTPDWIKKVCLF